MRNLLATFKLHLRSSGNAYANENYYDILRIAVLNRKIQGSLQCAGVATATRIYECVNFKLVNAVTKFNSGNGDADEVGK